MYTIVDTNLTKIALGNNYHICMLHRFGVSDYPYLCLGYKIAPGVPFSITVNVEGKGWVTITPNQIENDVHSHTIRRDDQ